MIQINKSRLAKGARLLRPLMCLPLVVSMFAFNSAQATVGSLTQTWTLTKVQDPKFPNDPNKLIDKRTPTSSIFGVANTPAWGYPNLPVPSVGTATINSTQGVYRFNLNYWNQDILGGNIKNTTMTVDVDDQTGAFVVKNTPSTGTGFSIANSYIAPGSRPQDNLLCGATFNSQDLCHWVPNVDPAKDPVHAPASYPSMYNGCHYGQCTQKGIWKDGTQKIGAPYPLQVNQITSIPSHWVVDTSARKSTGVFDVAYDIWLDKNPARNSSGNIDSAGTPKLPANPSQVNQNNGLEIMIWINHGGYTLGGQAKGSIIQPIGVLVTPTPITIKGVSGTWEVWLTQDKKAGEAPNDWYVVSYLRTEGVDDFEFDSKYFIDDAATRKCLGQPCVAADWWLTSIQAGFEIWADGEGLVSKSFTAKPTVKPVTVQGGRTHPDTGVPLVFWGESFDVKASCPTPSITDTATYSFTSTNSQTGALVTTTGNLVRDITGVLTTTLAAPYPNHGDATVTVTTVCGNGGGGTTTTNIYIDPAGTVKDTKGNALTGAKVVLYRSDTANGTFTAVPDGSTIMAPSNRANPDATGQYGDFAWDVIAGYYKVRASYGKCYAPGNPNQPWVDSAVVKIPPPVVNMKIVLECPQVITNPNLLTPTVNVYQDWGTGYCATVTVKNTTTKALDWETSFTVNGTIYQSWNMAYTKTGTKVTAGGIAWNNILQVNETSRDIGFCANRN